ncbi:PREDICTED: cytochrome P450 704C1-like isoform X2 [Tarenaya hassleriana]|uniref:cytochrome P450 704C1-like isoform X2 n=1 Tax=Tarenaya hassleriana TaxID=28532 RepID=UPI00053C4816|nr:PREDICTED: cytochrome P450 704C1-like isoform X2 [Tarenaya hassleriana]
MGSLWIPYYVAALGAILTLFIVRFVSMKRQKKKYHPVGGTMLNQLLNFKRLHHYMTDLASQHKTYRLLAPFRNEVYTSDPVNVEYILKSNFDNYGKGLYNYTILSDLLGDGIFAVDGEKWRQQRKLSSHQFSTRFLRDYSSLIFQTNAVKLALIVSDAASSDRIIDIQEGKVFSSAFDNASALTLWRYVDFPWKMKRFFNLGSEAALKKNVKAIDEFVYKLIRFKIEQMDDDLKESDNSSMQKADILSRFLQVTDTNDLKYLRDIILNFVIAGRDTTAATLSWLIYSLCKEQEIQEKVAEEVKEATGSIDITSFAELAESLSEETLEKMHYLHATITETLRLYPAVPVDAKICLSDDTFPDGFSVNKGDMVAYQPYAMGRMRFVWGDDAEEFRPERWLDENGKFRAESPFKFTAFQAGPRICLGKEFAYRQMKIFSAVMLRCFQFKLSTDHKDVTYKTMINLHVDGGLHVLVSHRCGRM